MRSRFLLALTCLCHFASGAHAAGADGVYAQLFPLTGEIQLRNKGATPISFDYYSIQSIGGTLNSSPLVWKSISDAYDVSGNGFVDSTTNWMKISTVATELAEGVFSGLGGTLPAMRAISLGKIWNAIPATDLSVEVQDTNGMPLGVTLEYAVAGDYLRDGVVDSLDYAVWRQNFGSTSSLDADGNLDGVVDAADYAIWRDNWGNSIPSLVVGSGSGSGSGLVLAGVVPEPATVAMSILALCWILLCTRRGAAGRRVSE